jgi:D-3-phosphoglycerate dehydrogenase
MDKILINTSSFDFKSVLDKYPIYKDKYIYVKNPYGRKLSTSELNDLTDKDVIGIIAGTETYDSSFFNENLNLRIISRCGIGLDNIDLNSAKKNNVKIYITESILTRAVAELITTFIMCDARNIVFHNTELHSNIWNRKVGKSMDEIVIGIVGMGKIGSEVAKIMNQLGSKIQYFDLYETNKNFPLVELPDLLSTSNYIILALTSDSFSLSKYHYSMMKLKPFIINTSRAFNIIEEDLFEALDKKLISGCALDVFQNEPKIDIKFSNYNNIILSPHAGSFTESTRKKMEEHAFLNLMNNL